MYRFCYPGVKEEGENGGERGVIGSLFFLISLLVNLFFLVSFYKRGRKGIPDKRRFKEEKEEK